MTEHEELTGIYESRYFRNLLNTIISGLTDRMYAQIKDHADREVGETYARIQQVKNIRVEIRERLNQIEREASHAKT